MENKELKVTLVSWPRLAVETIYTVWKASRDREELMLPEQVADFRHDPKFDAEVRQLFDTILHSKIPVIENLCFTFIIENMSISLREQMVRHRIGTRVGDMVGVDIVPEAHLSTWWSQTMRIVDVGTFADEGRYRIPEGIRKGTVDIPGPDKVHHVPAINLYRGIMKQIQDVYQLFKASGIPTEDAREVLPMALQHRSSWTLTLASLLHIIGKRSCWIAQSELWVPVIEGMQRELAEKVDPCFRYLASPPCITNECFQGCVVKADAEKRLGESPKDPLPVCPLYVHQSGEDVTTYIARYRSNGKWTQYRAMAKRFKQLWNRNLYTGVKLETAAR